MGIFQPRGFIKTKAIRNAAEKGAYYGVADIEKI
jgi:hypothetical protein